MGSPLAPAVPDLCVEHFEEPAEITVMNKSNPLVQVCGGQFHRLAARKGGVTSVSVT